MPSFCDGFRSRVYRSNIFHGVTKELVLAFGNSWTMC